MNLAFDLKNALLLVGEGTLYFACLAALFRWRYRFGLGVFVCALGTMHFLETYLASILYLRLAEGVVFSPGSSVLFAGKLVMILLLYIREDAAAVRQPIYGLLFGNFLIVGLTLLLRQHNLVSPIGAGAPDFAFIDQMGWLMVWGTVLLFIDSIMIILLYEGLGNFFKGHRTARILAAAAVVLTFDQLGFYLALKLYLGAPVDVLVGGWVGKMFAMLLYAPLAGAYLAFFEGQGRVAHGSRKLVDVFEVLTYRERYQALLEQSGRDALTGLLDRGRFDLDGQLRLREAASAGRPTSLLLLDVDDFKLVNDTAGHTAGDEILRLLAGRLCDPARVTDRAYRYGGEEFVVLCDDFHAQALIRAERLRREVSSAPLSANRITVSIGVASSPDDGTTLDALFAAADMRLYRAKAGGRDRVVGRSEPAPATRPSKVAGAR